MHKRLYHYQGIIHVHSTYSDGTKSIPEIADIANELDLDFLILTDHNTLKPKYDGLEGWYDKVLVGIGCELNDASDQNHYLSFDIDQEVDENLSPHEYVEKVKELGGFGIIAHPDENRSSMPEYPPYPWTIWESEGFDGIEIWNQMSEWLEGLTHKNKYWRVIHPRRSIIAPKPVTLAKWDKINMKRKVVGIGGVDAHGYRYRILKLIPITIFRYKVSFRTIRTHVFTEQSINVGDDPQASLQQIYKALKMARCFVSHNYFGDAADFDFSALNKNNGADIGGTIKVDGFTKLIVRNPRSAETYLIHNGRKVDRNQGEKIEFYVEQPGIYRVESHIKNRPWILSNHIRLEE